MNSLCVLVLVCASLFLSVPASPVLSLLFRAVALMVVMLLLLLLLRVMLMLLLLLVMSLLMVYCMVLLPCASVPGEDGC